MAFILWWQYYSDTWYIYELNLYTMPPSTDHRNAFCNEKMKCTTSIFSLQNASCTFLVQPQTLVTVRLLIDPNPGIHAFYWGSAIQMNISQKVDIINIITEAVLLSCNKFSINSLTLWQTLPYVMRMAWPAINSMKFLRKLIFLSALFYLVSGWYKYIKLCW